MLRRCIVLFLALLPLKADWDVSISLKKMKWLAKDQIFLIETVENRVVNGSQVESRRLYMINYSNLIMSLGDQKNAFGRDEADMVLLQFQTVVKFGENILKNLSGLSKKIEAFAWNIEEADKIEFQVVGEKLTYVLNLSQATVGFKGQEAMRSNSFGLTYAARALLQIRDYALESLAWWFQKTPASPQRPSGDRNLAIGSRGVQYPRDLFYIRVRTMYRFYSKVFE